MQTECQLAGLPFAPKAHLGLLVELVAGLGAVDRANPGTLGRPRPLLGLGGRGALLASALGRAGAGGLLQQGGGKGWVGSAAY